MAYDLMFLKADLKKIAFCGGRIHFTLRFVDRFIVIVNLYSVLVYVCRNSKYILETKSKHLQNE